MRSGENTLRLLLAPFDRFLADPAVTEIVVNKPGEIGVERDGVWSWHDAQELTFDRLDAIAILAGALLSKDVDARSPLVDTNLPGRQRLQACRPPATSPGIVALTIRRPPSVARSVGDEDFTALFAETNTGPSRHSRADAALLDLYHEKDWRGFFRLAVHSRKTIGALGPTGSGKTDFLRRLMRLVGDEERIITLEDTDEFGDLAQRNRVALFYGSPAVTPDDALRACLRMRPDRVMMQEVRGPEAFTLLRVLAAGHPGSMTTWHAEEGQGFEPLAMMVRQHPAGATIPDDKVRDLVRRFFDILVYCERGSVGFSAPRVWFKVAEEGVTT